MVANGFSTLPEVTRFTARTFAPNLGFRRALEKPGCTLKVRCKDAIRIDGVHDDEAACTIWKPGRNQ